MGNAYSDNPEDSRKSQRLGIIFTIDFGILSNPQLARNLNLQGTLISLVLHLVEVFWMRK